MTIEDMVHEATYPYPPELVWKVLTTREGMQAWLMENDFAEAKVGHKFTFRDRPRPFWDGTSPCEVIEAVPNRRFSLLWNTKDPRPSKVTWTLTPTKDGGTHLAFRHEGLRGFMGFMMRKGMDKGWRSMLDSRIPYVADQIRQGRHPTRDEVKEHARSATKAA